MIISIFAHIFENNPEIGIEILNGIYHKKTPLANPKFLLDKTCPTPDTNSAK